MESKHSTNGVNGTKGTPKYNNHQNWQLSENRKKKSHMKFRMNNIKWINVDTALTKTQMLHSHQQQNGYG